MGAHPITETHVKRSSSMSFARRWKHENLRLILLSSIISIAMTFMFLVLVYGASKKSVSVVVDGQEKMINTKQLVLQRLLDEQAITVGPHDELSIPLDSKLKNGDTIIINRSIPITVQADGKVSTVYTTSKTVGAAINELNISLSDHDLVTPSLGEKLNEGSTVKIVRVQKKVVQSKHEIPFDVVQKKDATLKVGSLKQVQGGEVGQIVKSFENVYEDGVLVSTTLMSKVVNKEAVDKIVLVGTKKPEVSSSSMTKNGVNFTARKTLKNVTLTAYSANEASTGKRKGDGGYGVTASGAIVKEGRTIAVDPDVIPLGWWVYIEGIGFRRAEDTGGAINGNIIDVYYDSVSQVNQFGRKKGYTVYVIGPNRPTSS